MGTKGRAKKPPPELVSLAEELGALTDEPKAKSKLDVRDQLSLIYRHVKSLDKNQRDRVSRFVRAQNIMGRDRGNRWYDLLKYLYSGNLGVRTASSYAMALRYMYTKKVEAESAYEFMSKYGGVRGILKRNALRLKRKRKAMNTKSGSRKKKLGA